MYPVNEWEDTLPWPAAGGRVGVKSQERHDPDARIPRAEYGTSAVPASLTIADFHFPAHLVSRRVTEYTRRARASGVRHSLKLWREAHEHTLVEMARQVASAPVDAPCESLFWEQQGNTFHVYVTFGKPAPRRRIH